jgi:hypothetical protein
MQLAWKYTLMTVLGVRASIMAEGFKTPGPRFAARAFDRDDDSETNITDCESGGIISQGSILCDSIPVIRVQASAVTIMGAARVCPSVFQSVVLPANCPARKDKTALFAAEPFD